MGCADTMDPRKKALLAFCLRDFDARWDEREKLLYSREGEKGFHGTRESVYYALALLERDAPGDAERAAGIISRVNSLQYLCPGQPWHGTFPSFSEHGVPPMAPECLERLGREGEYALDVFTERLFTRFREDLAAGGMGDREAAGIMATLRTSLRRVWPAVWDTYDPNWREFILCAYALILRFFEDRLPPRVAEGMDRAAAEGIAAAVKRAKSGVTPLNTNVRCVHILTASMFASRWRDGTLAAYAEESAAAFLSEYLGSGAAEFNSPTYNGVVLTYTPFMKAFGGPEVRLLGEALDAGMWSDLAEFYNPALKNICGPYTRCYEMDLRVHTAIPMLMYLDPFLVPEGELPPMSAETESAGVLCLGDRMLREDVRDRLDARPRGERLAERTFRELCERGEPGRDRSLCTATAYISDTLMYGCLRGSENTSHQLCALNVFWRAKGGRVSSLRLLREDRDGLQRHMRTVFFDFTAEKGRIGGTVSNRTGGRIRLVFEFESGGEAEVRIDGDRLRLDGLVLDGLFVIADLSGNERKASFAMSGPEGRTRRFCAALEDGETLRADISLCLETDESAFPAGGMKG